MSIIEKAVQDFQSKVSGGLNSVEVPEWDTTIYYKRTWSLKQQEPVNRLNSQGKATEAVVETLIIRALDEDGRPVFKRADKTELMNKVDPDVIARIVIEMSKEDDYSQEDVEKN